MYFGKKVCNNYSHKYIMKGAKIMSECNYLKYESGGWFENGNFLCEITTMQYDHDDKKVKHICKTSEHENCKIYKDR